MSLLVLPLATADSRADRDVRDVLLDAATILGRERWGRTAPLEGGDAAGRLDIPPEPFHIVPTDASLWGDPSLASLRKKGVVKIPQADDTGVLESTTVPLRRALDLGVRHVSRNAYREDTGCDPMVLIVPVLVQTDPHADEDEARAVLRRVSSATTLLQEVGEYMASAGWGAVGSHAASRFRMFPWVYLARPPSQLPESLFAGPAALASSEVAPILYASWAKGGQTRTWEEYGRNRLLNDLLCLYSLSSHRESLRAVFGQRQARQPEQRFFYRAHSSLYHYPLDDLLRHKALRRLRGDLVNDEGFLPKIEEMNIVAEEQEETVANEVASHVGAISTLLDTPEVHLDTFSFGPRPEGVKADFRHSVNPDFDIGPRQVRWRKGGDGGKSLATPDRDADGLHITVFQALQACASESLDSTMDDALGNVRKTLDSVTTELEGDVRIAFRLLGESAIAEQEGDDAQEAAPVDPAEDAEDGRTEDSTRKAVGRVLALIDGVSRAVDRMTPPEAGALKRPDEVMDEVRALGSSWNSAEEGLYRDRGKLSTMQAICVEVVAAVLAVASLIFLILQVAPAVSESWIATLPFGVKVAAAMVAGALGGYIAYNNRSSEIRVYFRGWVDQRKSMRVGANGPARDLVGILNRRIWPIKYALTSDLKNALKAARDRFVTELAGFIGLVDDALASSTRMLEQELPEPQTSGRFVVEIGDVEEIELDPIEFHHRLRVTIEGALELDNMPARVPVKEHQAIVKSLVERIRNRAGGPADLLRDTATEALGDAFEFGVKESDLSQAPGANTAGPVRPFSAAGVLVHERTEVVDAKTRVPDLPVHEPNHAVSMAMPEEMAAVLIAERMEVGTIPVVDDADGSGSEAADA
jgi:hypothetical protein